MEYCYGISLTIRVQPIHEWYSVWYCFVNRGAPGGVPELSAPKWWRATVSKIRNVVRQHFPWPEMLSRMQICRKYKTFAGERVKPVYPPMTLLRAQNFGPFELPAPLRRDLKVHIQVLTLTRSIA